MAMATAAAIFKTAALRIDRGVDHYYHPCLHVVSILKELAQPSILYPWFHHTTNFFKSCYQTTSVMGCITQ